MQFWSVNVDPKLHNDEFHNFYVSPNILWEFKSRGINGRDLYGERRNALSILVGNRSACRRAVIKIEKRLNWLLKGHNDGSL
jgi:hypothetical protein